MDGPAVVDFVVDREFEGVGEGEAGFGGDVDGGAAGGGRMRRLSPWPSRERSTSER